MSEKKLFLGGAAGLAAAIVGAIAWRRLNRHPTGALKDRWPKIPVAGYCLSTTHRVF
jgi:hypothetical protein